MGSTDLELLDADPVRSGNYAYRASRTTTGASRTEPRATTTAPSPTSTRRPGSIRRSMPTPVGQRVPRQQRPRPRHRGLQRGDPARSQKCPGVLQPGPRVPSQGRQRPRDRRLQRGDPADPKVNAHTGRGNAYRAKGDFDRAIATTTRRSARSQIALALQPGPRVPSHGRQRPRDRRLQRGDPARSQICPGLHRPGLAAPSQGRQRPGAIADYSEAIRLDPKIPYYYRS